jgi:hypothetical protein
MNNFWNKPSTRAFIDTVGIVVLLTVVPAGVANILWLAGFDIALTLLCAALGWFVWSVYSERLRVRKYEQEADDRDQMLNS